MRKTNFDSKIIIYRSRQLFLLACGAAANGIFMIMILKNSACEFPWFTLVFTITGIGLLFLVIPPTEEWEYIPWQNKPRRIEQHDRDRR